MTEAVRRRVALLRMEMDQKDIREQRLDHGSFRTPDWLKVPEEIQLAQIGLLRRASQTIDAMKLLMERREGRYHALCSKTPEHPYNAHKTSIDRLLQWKPDWDTENPTLAPANKIPRAGLQFQLDPISYSLFALNYTGQVELFLNGTFRAWLNYKSQVQNMATRTLSGVDYLTWRHWWDNTFSEAMSKWEVCVEGLIMPSWEEIVDEIYLLVLERVEDATEVANSLCSSRPTSQTNTPHFQGSATGYF